MLCVTISHSPAVGYRQPQDCARVSGAALVMPAGCVRPGEECLTVFDAVAERGERAMHGQPSATSRRVLVVDDDPALLEAICDGLALVGGYQVISASDGATGLERVITDNPDCVVVDVRMPGLNGYQFVRALRGDPETAETPLIILSALVQDHEQLAGLLTGADAYLTKPVKIMNLVATIDHSVRLTAAQRAERLHRMGDAQAESDER